MRVLLVCGFVFVLMCGLVCGKDLEEEHDDILTAVAGFKNNYLQEKKRFMQEEEKEKLPCQLGFWCRRHVHVP